MLYVVNLKESDGTWSPFFENNSLEECMQYALNRGIDFEITRFEVGRETVVYKRDFGKQVQRRIRRKK